jgi:hypothetical protein
MFQMSKTITPNRQVEGHAEIFEYGEKKIPFRFWAHTDDVNSIDTVIFMGLCPDWQNP